MNIPSKEYTLNIQRNRMTSDAFHASNCHFIVEYSPLRSLNNDLSILEVTMYLAYNALNYQYASFASHINMNITIKHMFQINLIKQDDRCISYF